MQIKKWAKESLYKFICDKVCINIKQSVQHTYKHWLLHIIESKPVIFRQHVPWWMLRWRTGLISPPGKACSQGSLPARKVSGYGHSLQPQHPSLNHPGAFNTSNHRSSSFPLKIIIIQWNDSKKEYKSELNMVETVLRNVASRCDCFKGTIQIQKGLVVIIRRLQGLHYIF